jgi:hypothetical protein
MVGHVPKGCLSVEAFLENLPARSMWDDVGTGIALKKWTRLMSRKLFELDGAQIAQGGM